MAGVHRQIGVAAAAAAICTCDVHRFAIGKLVESVSAASAMHSGCLQTDLERSRGHGSPCTASEEAEQVATQMWHPWTEQESVRAVSSGCVDVSKTEHGRP